MERPPVSIVFLGPPCLLEAVSSITFNACDDANVGFCESATNYRNDNVLDINDDDTLLFAQHYILQKIERTKAEANSNLSNNHKMPSHARTKGLTTSDEIEFNELIVNEDVINQQKRILDQIQAKKICFVPKEIEIPVNIFRSAGAAEAKRKSSSRHQNLRGTQANYASMKRSSSDNLLQQAISRADRALPNGISFRPLPQFSRPARQKRLTDSS